MSNEETFHIEMDSQSDDTVTIELDGELDMADAEWVEATLAAAADHHRHMVIDLAAVSFIDSTGVRSLIALQQRSTIKGIDVRFARPSPAVLRVLQAANLESLVNPQRTTQPDEH